MASQAESTCPCSTCAQRWFAGWIARPHPYTQNEQKFALLAGLLSGIQQKHDSYSDQIKYPLVELVFDYYQDNQEWVEMEPIRGWISLNSTPYWVTCHGVLMPGYAYNIRKEVPLTIQDAKFSEADIQAIENVICYRQDSAEILTLCKRYKVVAAINHMNRFETKISRYYALPTKQRVFALMERYQKSNSCPIL